MFVFSKVKKGMAKYYDRKDLMKMTKDELIDCINVMTEQLNDDAESHRISRDIDSLKYKELQAKFDLQDEIIHSLTKNTKTGPSNYDTTPDEAEMPSIRLMTIQDGSLLPEFDSTKFYAQAKEKFEHEKRNGQIVITPTGSKLKGGWLSQK